MPFQPGQSGNPAGRPRTGQSLAEYIRKLAGEDGKVYVDKLDAIVQSDKEPVQARLTAIGILLERGFGKPPQDLNLSGQLETHTTVNHHYDSAKRDDAPR